jgi:hypothetical protein
VNFTLGYIDPTHITARVGNEVDGLGNPVYRAITFLGPNLFQIAGTPAGIGVPVVFERTVPKTSLIVNFSNGDVLDEMNLDISQLQTIMAVQEVLDGRFSSLGTDLDFGNFTGINVRDPVADTDIANKRYVDDSTGDIATIIPGVNAAAATATAAATAAAASAAAAAASAASASGIPNDNSVTTIKVVDGAITEGKVANDAITTIKVRNSNITNAKLADMAQATVKGRAAGSGTGPSGDLTAAELRTIIGNVASGTPGLAPASGGGTTNFLRADGTWALPAGGNITLVAPQATTSGTQFDFTGLPAGINEIVVQFNGVSLSGTDQFLVQLGTSSGVETASYVSAGNALNTVGLGNFPSTSVAGFVIPAIGIVWAFNGQMFIRRMSGNTWNASLGGSGAAPGDFSVYYGGGIKTLAGTLDRVRLTRTGSSTFDAGAVSISYS